MSNKILTGVVDSISRGYKITNSFSNIEATMGRLNYDAYSQSSYLAKTPKAIGNPRKFTFSTWFKRNTVEYDHGGNAAIIFSSRGRWGGSPWFIVYLNGNDYIQIITDSGVGLVSQNAYRDTASWYHMVVSVDTTQATSSNRIKLYINGEQVTFSGSPVQPIQNLVTAVGQPYEHNLFVQDTGNSQILDAKFAETLMIDGQQLDPSSFGQINTITNVWEPKAYSGTFGVNGFYLKYDDTSSSYALAKDSKQILSAGADEHFGAVQMLLKGNTTGGTDTILDSSTNAFSITKNGNIAQGSHSPFYTYGSSYNSSVGSAYFDGSGDSLFVANSTNLQMATGDFTIEFWIKHETLSGYQTIIDKGYTSSGGFLIQTNPVDTGKLALYMDGALVCQESESPSTNAWIHYAITRSGTSVRIFKDGMLQASGTSSGNLNIADKVRIGTGGSGNDALFPFKGYLSNLKMVKGTALYTANFDRPTSPATATTGTQLLLNFANSTIQDHAATCNFENVGGVTVSTATKKFGSGSLYFNGSSYLKTPANANLDLGYTYTNDFTLECWINTTDTVGDIVSAFNTASPYKGYLFGIGFATAGKLSFYSATETQSQTFSSTASVNDGTWHHIAVTKKDYQLRFYIDGVLDSTHGIYVLPFFSGQEVYIGADHNTSIVRYFTGYIDDLRITNGVSRYNGSSFTAPSAELPDSGTHHWIPRNVYVHNGERILNPTYGAHRYWRYVVGNSVASHHPRVSRLILSSATTDTTILTYVSDNEGDTGTVPTSGTTASYDFTTPTTIVNAKIYSSFGDGTDPTIRSAWVSVQYSDDNTNWKTAFGGIIGNNKSTGIQRMLPPARSSVSYDSPTRYEASIYSRGNYAVLNHLDKFPNSFIRSGGLEFENPQASGQGSARATLAVPSTGKWYWEAKKIPSRRMLAGILKSTASLATYVGGDATEVNGYGWWSEDGYLYAGGTTTQLLGAYADNDVIGFMLDSDVGSLSFYKNGTLVYTKTSIGAGPWFPAIGSQGGAALYNFGQQPFEQTVPTGAKTLCTGNFPDPTIKLPNRYFDAKIYTPNAGTLTVSGYNFSPNLVWVKDRGLNGDEWWHRLYDSVRGVGQKGLYSNTTDNEGYWEGIGSAYNMDRLTAFTADGFTVEDRAGGGGLNSSPNSHVAWTWKEDAISGMDIVTYSGDGSASGRTIAHNLGSTPDVVIIKRRDSTGHWIIQHKGITTVQANSSTFTLSGYSNALLFTEGPAITYGYDGQVNTAGATYVAYLFKEVDSFSKFGTWKSTGIDNGPFINTGFTPRFVMWKSTTTGREWIMKDRARETYNASPDNARNLAANRGDQENDGTVLGGPTNANNIDWLSNGFKIRYSNANMNSAAGTETYIYMAFAEVPSKYALGK
jgi:hypothetical protein